MRAISSNIAAQIASSTAKPRTLYYLEIRDKGTGTITPLRLTNHGSDLTFQGHVYSSYRVKHSAIKTYLTNQVDNVTVNIDNVDLSMSAYFAYADFSGQKIEIYKVFLDVNDAIIDGYPTTDDKIVQFVGFMDTPKVLEAHIEIRGVNAFDRSQSVAPWRRFDAKCNWDFCKTECGYNSGNGKPRGTADSGSTTTLTDTVLVGISSMIGGSLKMLTGANKNEVRRISAHNTTTGQATFDALPYAVVAGDKYIIECDKSKSTCKGFVATGAWTGNEGNFGGYDNQLFSLQTTSTQFVAGIGNIPGSTVDGTSSIVSLAGGVVPIVYGYGSLSLSLCEEYITIGTATKGSGDRLYGICEGVIDSITSCLVNGKAQTPTLYNGAVTQSIDFHTKTRYYKRTAICRLDLSYDNAWNAGWQSHSDTVILSVKGLKVQQYDVNGSTVGQPFAWSNNPAWCILDFLINRSSKPIKDWGGALTDWIDFASFYNMAAVCTANVFELNLVLKEQKKDSDILDLMLAACRGYFTYINGQIQFNIEQAWPGAAAHSFDDASSGKTAGNICTGSFTYGEKTELNETPNRFIVKYIDQEIRENLALITSTLPVGTPVTSIGYGDPQGAFPTTYPWTGYIGAEAFTVNANDTINKILTIASWTPAKTYPSGYPIFQGAQTFPEMTAVYNGYDSQDYNKRVIEKKIDGSAIPKYKQAFNIAEFFGHKAIEGNVSCNFKGQMDSLHLTVGDVVNITHTLPGWIDAQFRVIEASESEDEEVDYTCELYDASFYAGNAQLPAVNLGTTLPNPYAVPGHVVSPSLSEDGYLGVDGTYVPTLILTYTLPSGDSAIFWDTAKVQVKVNAGAYSDYGIDTSRGAGYKIDGVKAKFKVGDTVYVKTISINTNAIMADATTAPVASTTILAAMTAPSPVANLRLEGTTGTVWNGLRFAVIWDSQGTNGNEPSNVFVDVEVWTGGFLQHTFTPITECRWEYVFGDGIVAGLDDAIKTANGAVTIKARRKNAYGSASSYTTLALTNAAPSVPTSLAANFNGPDLVVTWGASAAESDFSYYELILAGHAKILTVSSYTYSFAENIKDNTTPAASVTYSLKAYDIYGNASAALTGTFTNPGPATPAGLLATTFLQSIKFAWANAAETDIDHWKVRTSLDGGTTWGAWEDVRMNSYLRTVTVAELAGASSKTVYIQVKAVDLFGQESVTAATTSGSTEQVVAENLYTALRVDFLVRDSIFSFGDSATAPSNPSKTTLYWTAGVITWKGTDYTLPAGNLTAANAQYIVATLSAGVATLSLKPMTSEPLLNNNQVIIAYTSSTANGVGNYLCYVRQANSMMLEGANIRDLTVTSAKITSLAAGKVVTGILTDAVGSNYWNLDTGAAVFSGSITIKGTPITAIEDAATHGAAWGTNLTGRPTELTDGRVATALNAAGTVVTKVVPASVAGPGAAGLYLGSDYLGYYSGIAWKTYMQNNGNFYLSGTGTHGLTWDGTTLNIRGSINADDIVAGTVTGRTLQTGASGKRFVVTAADGEALFYGDRGDTTIERLIRLGVSAGADPWVAEFGSPNCSKIAITGRSNSSGLAALFQGRVQSDVATGTAPFVIASTTMSTNLNADLLDGSHASAFADVTNAAYGKLYGYASFTATSLADATEYEFTQITPTLVNSGLTAPYVSVVTVIQGVGGYMASAKAKIDKGGYVESGWGTLPADPADPSAAGNISCRVRNNSGATFDCKVYVLLFGRY